MPPERLIDGPVLWRLGEGASPAGPHVAVVPGARAPLLPLDLPAGLRGIARERVAARQLAEMLAMPQGRVELFPFAPDGKAASFAAMVVAEAEDAKGWRAGLRPGCLAVLPDYLTLPCIAEVWTLDTGADGLVAARLGPGDGFTAEPELAVRLLGAAEVLRAVLRLGPAEPALDAFLGTLEVPVHERVEDAGKPLRWMVAAGGVDLAAAPSALYDRLGAGLARWRWPLVLGVLALAAWLGTLVLETQQLRARAEADAAQTRNMVRAHFVPEGPILNVRAQVEAAVLAAALPEQVIADAPPLVQLQRAAPVLTRDGVRMQTAEYRADTGLVAALETGDFAALDALVADLRETGFLVEMIDSRAQASGGIAAQLRLQEGPIR